MAFFSSLLTALGGGAAAAGSAGATAGAATGLSGALGAVSTAAGIAGTVMQYQGQKEAAEQQQKQENIRQTQANIEASRQRRDLVRRAVVARSEALSNASAQGAGQSSGLAGGQAQITQATGSDIAGVNQAQQLGNQMFASNRALSAAQTRTSMGAGLSSLGNAVFQNQEQLGRLGTYSIG